ncbi:MAG: hypothetical protein P4L69_20285 [Desulfosporosinus sp.]|nr:hypothetical protein [Desulfosporosinus sp.]
MLDLPILRVGAVCQSRNCLVPKMHDQHLPGIGGLTYCASALGGKKTTYRGRWLSEGAVDANLPTAIVV